jgi:predicted Fe-S protein YdhL (DUF1289 family)
MEARTTRRNKIFDSHFATCSGRMQCANYSSDKTRCQARGRYSMRMILSISFMHDFIHRLSCRGHKAGVNSQACVRLAAARHSPVFVFQMQMPLPNNVPKPNHLPPPIPSPCVGVCRVNHIVGLCEGCMRTLDEISRWSVMSEDEKLSVWQRLSERRDEEFGSSG